MTVETFMGKRLAEYDPPIRGDAITGDRYYSKEWMEKEWNGLWTRIWHVGGLMNDLQEPGDYLVHNFLRESVLMIRQEDGSVRAFFNACRHRGNRLVWSEVGFGDAITCSYHGWKWGIDGTLVHAQDAEDFAGGNPCGKVKLVEIRCAVWGGFVWYNMDQNAKPLEEWLAPLPEQMKNYQMETMKRVLYVEAVIDCNWKIIRDNFNESYHLPTLHPELATFIDDDYTDTSFEMYPSGHNRMVQKGCSPSNRLDLPEALEAPLSDILAEWGMDPEEYKGRAKEARLALQKQKRELGRQRGFKHHDTMTDSQLTDYYHYTLWPNLTLTMSPDGFQVLRSEPHPTDPEKCIFQHWYLMPPVEGRDEVVTPVGTVPFGDNEKEIVIYGEKSLGFVADQDMSIAIGQQQGLHSRGYTGGVISGQEKRIQRFHELLNDAVGH
ncbi:aromatic ring-hydroxylating oxygenase subunit alpha [Sphingomonas profundi]|uniref:aromatic ring-hydroxylating oxygenase subunit alpha n=1 Tax=Alterirhizorhabdus profundi TaxID=2681549 RepID=UPI0012E7E7E7|nr:aromatic ring-hydroxylating dioxygenase subunit alpha [Sphingomonas profundi]